MCNLFTKYTHSQKNSYEYYHFSYPPKTTVPPRFRQTSNFVPFNVNRRESFRHTSAEPRILFRSVLSEENHSATLPPSLKFCSHELQKTPNKTSFSSNSKPLSFFSSPFIYIYSIEKIECKVRSLFHKAVRADGRAGNWDLHPERVSLRYGRCESMAKWGSSSQSSE